LTLGSILPIDLVNLDYCSGLIYEGFERVAAIESLFRWQARGLSSTGRKNFPYFLLFITHNSDPKAGKQTVSRDYVAYLTSKEATLYQGTLRQDLQTAVNWYLSDNCPPEYRHKVFVFGKVLEFAQAAGFKISIRNAIAFKGDHKTPMMHYQFEAYPHSIGHPIPVDSHINVCDIINWPVIDISGQDIASNDRPKVALP
jgi:hypothetical protein